MKNGMEEIIYKNTLVTDQYLVMVDTKAQVSELVLGLEKWYQNMVWEHADSSKYHITFIM